MRTLTLKLTLSFIILSLASVGLVAISARWSRVREFDRLVLNQELDNFTEAVTAYYETHNTWSGIGRAFAIRSRRQKDPARGNGRNGGPPIPPGRPEPPPELPFVLLNTHGCVVLSAGRYRAGDCLATSQLSSSNEVRLNEQVIGTILALDFVPTRTPQEQAFLARTDRASVNAALGITALSLAVGILLARTLTRPLQELTAAIRAMRQGDLAQRVAIRSKDELGELANAFNQMSADLAQAHQARRQMTADIAHDLRTPLSVLTGYIEALRDGDLLPSAQRFEIMHQEAQQLNRLIEDLRTLSLADAGALPLQRQRIDPQILLAQVAASFQTQATEKGITLQVTQAGLSTSNLVLDLDPIRMAQVLGNLVSNALRYTPEGGQVSLSTLIETNQTTLMVTDNGVGIISDTLPYVFDRFYRVDISRQQDQGQSGLGLAIAKSIVEAHGGTITVKSEVGQGTQFSITFNNINTEHKDKDPAATNQIIFPKNN